MQDYFTDIPLPDQTTSHITTELIKFFCTQGHHKYYTLAKAIILKVQYSLVLKGIIGYSDYSFEIVIFESFETN